jgi:hypothetical protein
MARRGVNPAPLQMGQQRRAQCKGEAKGCVEYQGDGGHGLPFGFRVSPTYNAEIDKAFPCLLPSGPLGEYYAQAAGAGEFGGR